MKKIWWIIIVAALMIAANVAGAADSTWATWFAVDSMEGLSVKAYETKACTGTPPAVEPGGTAYIFTDYGNGIYMRKLVEEEYYLFVESAFNCGFYHSTRQNKLDLGTVEAANWVTSPRMADNAIGAAEITDGTVGAAEIATGGVGSLEIADAAINWVDFGTGIKGSGLDTTKTLKSRFDTLDLMRGSWNSGTDFDMGEMDSLLKKVLLNLAFAAPCTVRIDVQGRSQGVKAFWQMNTVHNDSAVYRYRVYYGSAVPGFYASGELDSLAQLTLEQQMEGSYKIEPRRNVNAYTLPMMGLWYVVVTAEDWQGTVWGSAWDSARSADAGVGAVTTLTGAPGYTAGMDGMTALRDALSEIAVLKNQQAQTAAAVTTGVRVLVYADNVYAGSAYNDVVQCMNARFYRIKTGGPPSRKVSGVFKKFFGYNRLCCSLEARMKTVGAYGWMGFDEQG